jgi:hypothetical protein
MQNIIIKRATPLSFLALLALGSVSMKSQANENMDPILSNSYGKTISCNGMRGKPPYNRMKMNRQCKKNNQSVEMSALEISQDLSTTQPSPNARKRIRIRSGHPGHSKRRYN